MNNLYKGKIVAYNCNNPIDVTSYQLKDIEECEKQIMQESSRNVKMQILQKSKKYTAKGYMCELKRTREVAHCGQVDHMVKEFKNEFD